MMMNHTAETSTTDAEREAEFVALLCRVPADEREEVLAMLTELSAHSAGA